MIGTALGVHLSIAGLAKYEPQFFAAIQQAEDQVNKALAPQAFTRDKLVLKNKDGSTSVEYLDKEFSQKDLQGNHLSLYIEAIQARVAQDSPALLNDDDKFHISYPYPCPRYFQQAQQGSRQLMTIHSQAATIQISTYRTL